MIFVSFYVKHYDNITFKTLVFDQNVRKLCNIVIDKNRIKLKGFFNFSAHLTKLVCFSSLFNFLFHITKFKTIMYINIKLYLFLNVFCNILQHKVSNVITSCDKLLYLQFTKITIYKVKFTKYNFHRFIFLRNFNNT